MIKIDFEMTNGTYTYRDALHLPEDHTFTEAEIEQIKQERFNKWITIITSPPAEESLGEPVEEPAAVVVEETVPVNAGE